MVNDLQFDHTRSSIRRKQSAWDKPIIAADLAVIKSHFFDSFNTARLLAVSAPYSGDWLHALPLATCGLKLDNKAIRIAVGLRLGISLCEPHQCPCGKLVDARGTHGLSCKRGEARVINFLDQIPGIFSLSSIDFTIYLLTTFLLLPCPRTTYEDHV